MMECFAMNVRLAAALPLAFLAGALLGAWARGLDLKKADKP